MDSFPTRGCCWDRSHIMVLVHERECKSASQGHTDTQPQQNPNPTKKRKEKEVLPLYCYWRDFKGIYTMIRYKLISSTDITKMETKFYTSTEPIQSRRVSFGLRHKQHIHTQRELPKVRDGKERVSPIYLFPFAFPRTKLLLTFDKEFQRIHHFLLLSLI